MTDRAARTARRGFTLLEVMVAMAILAISLVAIAGINSGAMTSHAYAKRLTVATLLARSKMADLEQILQSEGFPADDTEEDGTFEEEGQPGYRWRAEIIRPKTEDIAVGNLLSMTGMFDSREMEDLASKVSGGKAGGGPSPGVMGALAGGAGGAVAGLMQTQMQTMLDQLGQSIREVRLTVSWKNGKVEEKFTVVTHVISAGAGTDQMSSQQDAALGGGAQGGGLQGSGLQGGGLQGGGLQGGGLQGGGLQGGGLQGGGLRGGGLRGGGETQLGNPQSGIVRPGGGK